MLLPVELAIFGVCCILSRGSSQACNDELGDASLYIRARSCPQVTLAIATVALKAVAGAELQGSSDFMHGVEDGLVEELADLSFDQDVLLGVSSGGEDAEAALRKSACFSGEEDAGAVLRRSAWASYEAITEFMNKEETKRRSKAKNVDSYIDFRDSMREVDDGTGGLVWVRTENVPRWRELMPAAAPAS